MEYRSLGRTGTQVSAYCVGTMNFGAATDAAETARIIDRAVPPRPGRDLLQVSLRQGLGAPAVPGLSWRRSRNGCFFTSFDKGGVKQPLFES